MNQYYNDNSFNCTYGCQNANECQYNNSVNNLPSQQPVASSFVDNHTAANYYNESANLTGAQYVYGGDSVVPVNNYDSGQVSVNYAYQNFPSQSSAPQYEYYVANPNMPSGSNAQAGGYFTDNVESYPPCQGPQPWNYAQCYGYYGEAPCQFSNVVDMEDFM